MHKDSERLLNKVPKRRKKYICTNIALLNNAILNDLMIVQEYLFAKKEQRIECLEKEIMVYSNIMFLPFDKQCNWCENLNKEIALLNGMIDDETEKSKFRVTVLDWSKINKFETLRNMADLHRYTHGKAVRAVGQFENGTTPLLIGLIDEAFYRLMKANSYIPRTKAEYEERAKNIEIVLQNLNKIQFFHLCYRKREVD